MPDVDAIAREHRQTLEYLAAGGCLRERTTKENPRVKALHDAGFLQIRVCLKHSTDYEISRLGREAFERLQGAS